MPRIYACFHLKPSSQHHSQFFSIKNIISRNIKNIRSNYRLYYKLPLFPSVVNFFNAKYKKNIVKTTPTIMYSISFLFPRPELIILLTRFIVPPRKPEVLSKSPSMLSSNLENKMLIKIKNSHNPYLLGVTSLYSIRVCSVSFLGIGQLGHATCYGPLLLLPYQTQWTLSMLP